MKNTTVFLAILLMLSTLSYGATRKTANVYILNPALLLQSKQRLQHKDPALMPALNALKEQAEAALSNGPYSVMDKQEAAPTGDKHDYYSLAIYWWPNPDTENHLPYIRRDGQVNPEIGKFDGGRIAPMASTVYTLALAYYFTDDERYAQRCALLLRIWFINEDTRMNPHLRFAQHIPGVVTEGNCSGLIDTVVLATNVVDSIGLISSSKSWTKSDQAAIRKWFQEYLNWLQTSKPGKEEAAQNNNHGFWYDAQVMAYALLVDNRKLVADTAAKSATARISKQIMPNGSQLAELLRTKAFDYSLYSMDAMFGIASMAERVNVDVWNYKGAEGQSIKSALEFLIPYADGSEKWPYAQITGFHPENLFPFLRRASIAYKDHRYEALISKLPGNPSLNSASITNLLYPPQVKALIK